MGIITSISSDLDDSQQVVRVFAITKFGINSRAQLNRVAARCSGVAGAGQRTLVASAYDEEGIDLVFNKGLGVLVDPEEQYDNAKEINYRSTKMEQASEFGDILTTRLEDRLEFGNFRPSSVLHVWEVPYKISDRGI